MIKSKLDPLKVKTRIMQIGYDTQCGHIASAMSCVDLLVAMYKKLRKKDILILSKGHGALAQYVILNELGRLPDRVLETYYKDGGLTGHSTLMPEYGVYASTGSLGHGLPIGIGYAIANPKRSVVVVLSDGELDEGSNWEAIRFLEKYNLPNLIVFCDWNENQGYSKPIDFNAPRIHKFYSIKGEDWGELENTIKSHYVKVDQELFCTWTYNMKARTENATTI